MQSTRTYVRYFGRDAIVDLQKAASALRSDFAQRRPYISNVNADKMLARLYNLDLAIEFLIDPAEEQ